MLRRSQILTTTALLAVCAAPASAATFEDLHPSDVAPPASIAPPSSIAASEGDGYQDLRSPDARDAAREAGSATQLSQDLRSPDAIDAAQHPRKAQAVDAPGATAVDSQSTNTPVAPGQPTWAVNPQPIPPAPAPAATPTDDGVDWGTIGIGLAVTLLVLGGIAVVTSRTRSTPRTRVSV